MEKENLFKRIFDASSDGMIITDLETGRILIANPAAAEMHGDEQDSFCGMRLQKLLHEESRSFLREFSEVVIQGGLFAKTAQHVSKDDSLFFVEWRSVAFSYHSRSCALSILRDISERISEEKELKQRMLERELEQTTLLDISQTLASKLELQPGLILDKLGILIKYNHASLFTIEDSTLIASAVRGDEKLESEAPYLIRLDGKSTLETLFNNRQPIRIADIWSDEGSAKFLRNLLNHKAAPLLKGVHSWMWVPLAVKDRIIGGFGIANKERNYFTLHDAEIAMTIANQAALTLTNVELYEHAQMLAALQERQHLAQNLHDAVNQSLFSAGIIADVLPRLWEKDPDEGKRSLQDLRHLINGATAEMRALLAELKPTTLTDTELGELLLLLGNAFTGRTNIPVNIMVNGEKNLVAKSQVAIYRICQEALNNIAKHAKAGNVEIEVHHTPKELCVYIRDDGCGFDISAKSGASHFGFAMMRERAEEAGAELIISSQPGQGTQIEIRWRSEEEK